MKALAQTFSALLAGLLAFSASRVEAADTVPELLHYKFNGTGISVPNLASSPPAGTATATIMGGLTQSGTDLNLEGTGFSLVGSGLASSTDYLNTGWATNLSGTSWTISFVSSNFPPSSTLYYVFGDATAGSFRCFTNGVAGANNWVLRGGFTDVYVNGGAVIAPHRTTFVYDMALGDIKGYLDGTLVTTVAQVGPVIAGPGPFKVMGYGSNVGAPPGGLIDDFRLYNRALSQAEVQDIDAYPIIGVSGGGVDIVDGDSTPDALDGTAFGSASTTAATVVRTFTIENTGNRDLDLGTVTVGGAHAADFTVTALPTTPVAAAGSTTFEVTFDPSARGLRSATLSFATNDINANPFDFSIEGTGLAPVIRVSGNGVTILDGDATPDAADHTDFGGAARTGGTVVRTFTVENVGELNLALGTLTLGGSHPQDFTVTLAPVTPVGAAGSTTFEVTFDPSATGVRSATVSFVTNDDGANPFDFSLQGTGLAPAIAVSGNALPIVDGDSTPDVADGTDFGSASSVTATVVRSFVIQNLGNAELSLGTVIVGGPHAGDFTVSTAPLSPVGIGGSTTLGVTFDPSASGVRSATLSFSTNDDVVGTFDFTVQGTGIAADVQASITNFADGVLPGRDTLYTIQVLNAGPDPVASVHIVDDVPEAALTNAQWSCTSQPPALCPNANGGPDIDQTTGPLPNGALIEYSLIATPVGTLPGSISNTVVATNLDGTDPNLANNTATDTDALLPEGIFSNGFEEAGMVLLKAPIGR